MKYLKSPLVLFLTIFILGLIARYLFGKNSNIWNFMEVLDTASAVALAVMAFFAYKNMLRDEDEIELYFRVKQNEYPLNLKLLRKNCTRGEILGLLGQMQRVTENRFRMNPKNLKSFLQEINKVQREKEKKLFIPIEQEEFEQFKLEEIK
jgi:hypothetical protein